MQKKINIEITFNKRSLYALITITTLIIICVGVYAFNTSNPAVLGHTINEIECDNNFCAIDEKIGIGTTNPETKLDVYGNIKANQLITGDISLYYKSPINGNCKNACKTHSGIDTDSGVCIKSWYKEISYNNLEPWISESCDSKENPLFRKCLCAGIIS